MLRIRRGKAARKGRLQSYLALKNLEAAVKTSLDSPSDEKD